MLNAVGIDNLAGNDANRKNGKAPFNTETSDFLPWNLAGCPNSNWVGHIDFVYWTAATLTVHSGFNNPNGAILETQTYSCVTTRNPDSVSCTPATLREDVKGRFKDGHARMTIAQSGKTLAIGANVNPQLCALHIVDPLRSAFPQ